MIGVIFDLLGINERELYDNDCLSDGDKLTFISIAIIVSTLVTVVLCALILIHYFVNPFMPELVLQIIFIALAGVSVGLIAIRLIIQHRTNAHIKHFNDKHQPLLHGTDIKMLTKISQKNIKYIVASLVTLISSLVLMSINSHKPITQLIK